MLPAHTVMEQVLKEAVAWIHVLLVMVQEPLLVHSRVFSEQSKRNQHVHNVAVKVKSSRTNVSTVVVKALSMAKKW